MVRSALTVAGISSAARVAAAALAGTAVAAAVGLAVATAPAAADPLVFHGALNGEILNVAVDPTGTEGMLGEFVKLGDNDFETALETFNLSTGDMISFIKHRRHSNGEDDVPLTVTGDHTGLFVTEKTNRRTGLVKENIYQTLAPLSGNAITGTWTPPGNRRLNLVGVGHDITTSTTVFLAERGHASPKVSLFGSDVTANTFTPRFDLPSRFNTGSILEYDASSGHAVLSSWKGCESCRAQLWTANLATGAVDPLVKLRHGAVLSIAGDPFDQVLCTTTSSDFSVEFYNLATHTLQTIPLPNATGSQHQATVLFDAANHLFLVSQPQSTTGSGNLYLYAPDGTLTGTVAGVNMAAFAYNSTLRKVYGRSGLKDVVAYDY
ncbi:MAG: hypothetical protein JOZ72_08290 [Alphaproteobacteria bacterium]|nr:hypothetical protein [Alphaproteobacteria bacterium]